MNKKLLLVGIAVLLICVGLSGCIESNEHEDAQSDGKEDTEPDEENDTEPEEDEDTDDDFWDELDTETIMISGIDTVQTVHHLDKLVKLMVSGIRNDVTVTKETNLVDIMLSGVDCIVRVSRTHSFDSSISGVGSEIVYYD